MIEESIKKVLLEIEGDAALDGNGELREGLRNTPKRVVESWKELYSGYNQDPKETLNATFNGEGYDGIVLLKDIEFYSTCEHHMLSFTGKAHVAYIPTDRIVGISKLARIVDIFAKRLQTQETMTAEIGNSIQQYLNPKGVAVYVSAEHHCMSSRGVNKTNVDMVTTHFLGEFKETINLRERFLSSI